MEDKEREDFWEKWDRLHEGMTGHASRLSPYAQREVGSGRIPSARRGESKQTFETRLTEEDREMLRGMLVGYE